MVYMAALAGSATHPNGMPMALTSGQGPQLQGHAAAFPGIQSLMIMMSVQLALENWTLSKGLAALPPIGIPPGAHELCHDPPSV